MDAAARERVAAAARAAAPEQPVDDAGQPVPAPEPVDPAVVQTAAGAVMDLVEIAAFLVTTRGKPRPYDPNAWAREKAMAAPELVKFVPPSLAQKAGVIAIGATLLTSVLRAAAAKRLERREEREPVRNGAASNDRASSAVVDARPAPIPLVTELS